MKKLLFLLLLFSCAEEISTDCYQCRVTSAVVTNYPYSGLHEIIYVDTTYLSNRDETSFVTREIGWTKRICFKIITDK